MARHSSQHCERQDSVRFLIFGEFAHLSAPTSAWVKENTSSRLLVDLWADMKTDEAHKSLWARDGLHFSAEGYRHFASLIAAQLATSPVTAGKPWHKSAAAKV